MRMERGEDGERMKMEREDEDGERMRMERG